MCHELECLPKYFKPLASGRQTFVVCKSDRPFEVNDVITLNEFVPESPEPDDDTEYKVGKNWRKVDGGFYTGVHAVKKISYILNDKEFCLEGTVILGLAECTTFDF